MAGNDKLKRVHALKVNQWMKAWEAVDFDPKSHRRQPEPNFYIFSIPAVELKSLCGISRREAKGMRPRAADLGIQRQHDKDRSKEINRFVDYGFPWSTLSDAKRRSPEFHDMRKPGWLPTSIVVNILQKDDVRDGDRVSPKDLVKVVDGNGVSSLQLPYEKWTREWEPTAVPPLEVIDGQHRLWAFTKESKADDFEVPVVAFNGLDISWQAYLFYTINIKPKRINTSLAYDLYPLLRLEDWLDRAEGHAIYRETRSQELAEALWSLPESPWYDKINMLGEKKNNWPTQAAWIKSLMATFIRPWDGKKSGTGGLFGSRMKFINDGIEVLNWSRPQQAAFLIYAWQALKNAIDASRAPWLRDQRAHLDPPAKPATPNSDFAFYGNHTLISTDQGVRGYLHVVNDMCFVSATRLELNTWRLSTKGKTASDEAVALALDSIKTHKLSKFLDEIAKCLADFDWRTSSDPSLDPNQQRKKIVFRGSSGYKELRMQLLELMSASKNADIAKAASVAMKAD